MSGTPSKNTRLQQKKQQQQEQGKQTTEKGNETGKVDPSEIAKTKTHVTASTSTKGMSDASSPDDDASAQSKGTSQIPDSFITGNQEFMKQGKEWLNKIE